MKLNPLTLIDFYKADHRRQYPKGTELVYSNFTPRSTKYMPTSAYFDDKVVFFGLQYFIKYILIETFNDGFFKQPKKKVVADYKRRMDTSLGAGAIPMDHIEALHDLGYLPISIKSLPEGATVNAKIPVFTIVNTKPEFFWLTNYLETILSNIVWKPCTSATTAYKYKQLLMTFAKLTGGDEGFVQFESHDFSFRGMSGPQDASSSGAGHLTSFVGTDSVCAIDFLEQYYNADSEKELVGCSVPASEHSVLCMDGPSGEFETFKRLMTELYPKGIVSIVSDSFDFWQVITNFLPRLKKEIMARSGGFPVDKVVIRPDCYSEDTLIFTKNGWKLFSDLKENDLVAQVLDDGSYEFVKPLKIVTQKYKGEMHHFKDFHGKVDLLVTPNHRMILNQEGKERIVFAEKLGEFGNHKQHMIRTASAPSKPEVKLTDLERLKIAFQADGSFCTRMKSSIRFHFTKVRKIDRLDSILIRMGVEYKKYPITSGGIEFSIKVNALDFQKDFEWVDASNLSKEWCQEFIEELSYWDATRRHKARFKFDTTVEIVSKKLEFIAIGAGYGIFTVQTPDDRKEQFSDIYTSYILKDNSVGGQSWEHKIENYNGMIYCVQVQTGKILVKRNKGTMVCGNSGDPVEIICGERIKNLDLDKNAMESIEDLKDAGTWVAESLVEKIKEKTPHGECGDSEASQLFKYQGKCYKVTVEIDWNRYDKQFYYIDGQRVKSVEEVTLTAEQKGAIESLWGIFGGTITSKGYKVLDSHIGLIYGDSITLERCEQIMFRLKEKGFASTNVVLGTGSYSYQYKTRDNCGFAMKATAGIVNGQMREIFKDPKTDQGLKKSAKGLLRVELIEGEYVLKDCCTVEEEKGGELKEVFRDGKLLIDHKLSEIRERVSQSVSKQVSKII